MSFFLIDFVKIISKITHKYIVFSLYIRKH